MGRKPRSNSSTFHIRSVPQPTVKGLQFTRCGIGARVKRTLNNMQRRRECVAIIERANGINVPRGAAVKARRKAHYDGVCLLPVKCPWAPPFDANWVFGPDPDNDNVYQCVPQVRVHVLHES